MVENLLHSVPLTEIKPPIQDRSRWNFVGGVLIATNLMLTACGSTPPNERHPSKIYPVVHVLGNENNIDDLLPKVADAEKIEQGKKFKADMIGLLVEFLKNGDLSQGISYGILYSDTARDQEYWANRKFEAGVYSEHMSQLFRIGENKDNEFMVSTSYSDITGQLYDAYIDHRMPVSLDASQKNLRQATESVFDLPPIMSWNDTTFCYTSSTNDLCRPLLGVVAKGKAGDGRDLCLTADEEGLISLKISDPIDQEISGQKNNGQC